MTSRRWALVVVVAVIAVAAGYLANRETEPSIGRGGSDELAGGQPVVINRTPRSYMIAYTLEERLAESIRRSTETLAVRRPFDARVETRNDGRDVSTIVWTLGRNSSTQGDADPLVSDQPPDVAGADARLAPALDDALRDGRINRLERRRVAGRVCQVFRTKQRLVAARLEAPAEADYVDSCVDRDGLVLEEVQVREGERQLRRIARRVTLDPAFEDALFAVGKSTLDVTTGGGSTRPVDPSSTPPGQFWQLDQPPDGYTLLGRFSVVPPQPENFTDPLREAYRRAEVSDVFVRGVDLIVVSRGATLRGQNAFEPDPTNAPIDLGAVGSGEVVLTGQGNEVRALLSGGRYVRITGTVPVAQLAAIARQLHLVPGGELRFLDN